MSKLSLKLASKGLSNISSINFPNRIKKLDLSDNTLLDLVGLPTKLEELILDGNSNITTIGNNHTNLLVVSANDCNLTDSTVIPPNVQCLYLNNNIEHSEE